MEKVLSPEKITKLSQLDMNGLYSYLDYLSWKFEERVELIKGKIFPMAAPNFRHQIVLSNLYGFLFNFFRDQPCRYIAAPFDVRLHDKQKPSKNNLDFNTVVQPDACVVCDPTKIDIRGYFGSPELMVEVLSPGNTTKEMRTKKRLYEENGVKEYWIIDFEREQVFQFVLNDAGIYDVPKIYLSDEILVCVLFPELKINPVELFKA